MTIHTRHIRYLLIMMLAVSALAVITAAACASDRSEGAATLRVFAASSLTDVLTEVSEVFEAENEGVQIEMHFAGSSRLRAQLDEGAVADAFISADPRHIDAIAHLLVDSSITTVATNEMVVALSDSGRPIQSLEDLAKPGVKIVIALQDVPAGRYAHALIADMAQQQGFPAEFDDAVLGNIVSEETNVRAVLAKVQLGEADAGFVYQSDIRDTGLHSLIIPDQNPGDIAYVGALLRDSSHHDTAQAFLGFLVSEAGQRILISHGFLSAEAFSINAGVAMAATP
ncbi:MAG: molybdate ABC transporter substrate-binding protein [Chloroflexi bacterium]|nr:molybdate ABC transporter substrate-binding protein [Chloroflexota bacterium]